MKYSLCQSFHFEAAHTLERRVDAESSRRVHGHTYQVEIAVSGTPQPATGMVCDLGVLRDEVARVRALLDHRLLDDVDGLGAPTLENLCRFIWNALDKTTPSLARVAVGRGASGDRCVLERD